MLNDPTLKTYKNSNGLEIKLSTLYQRDCEIKTSVVLERGRTVYIGMSRNPYRHEVLEFQKHLVEHIRRQQSEQN